VTFLVQALVAGLLTALLIVWLRRPAQRLGLLDHAGGRKRHGESIPLTGGVAMALAVFLTLLFSAPVLARYAVLLVALALLAGIGLLDDLGEVSPRGKLGVQVLAALFMTSWAGHHLADLGDILDRGPLLLQDWGIPLTVLAVVAVTNGLNMLDGLDGLAGGLAFGILALFAVFASGLHDAEALKLLVVALGALAGFLAFNLPHPLRGRRRTFMGDTGSLVLGFLLAWFSVELTQRPGAHVPAVVMPWVMGVVLLDLLTVTLRRLVRRRDPSLPDRGHIHHLLQRRGAPAGTAVAILVGGNLLLGLAGLALWRLGAPEWLQFTLFLAVTATYLAFFLLPSRLWRLLPRRRRPAEQDAPEPPSDARRPQS
jgi:UDP-GlcNAc:undecaprenyl-phosphate GlcNAc-1-phosphate transferase